jgi:hypothetical protein
LNVEKNKLSDFGMEKLKQIKCEECGNKSFFLVEELQENKKTKLAELNVSCVCDKCLKVNGDYTVQLGVPITMLGTIDFVIKLQNSKEKKSD